MSYEGKRIVKVEAKDVEVGNLVLGCEQAVMRVKEIKHYFDEGLAKLGVEGKRIEFIGKFKCFSSLNVPINASVKILV